MKKLCEKIQQWIEVSSEVCIAHYRASRKEIPIWAVVETLPFDTISKMPSYHKDARALRDVYKALGLPKQLEASSGIVHATVYLRNLCAHHSRLWKREVTISAPRNKQAEKMYIGFSPDRRSIGSSLLHVMYMVDKINGDTTYSKEILAFLESHKDYMQGILTSEHWS